MRLGRSGRGLVLLGEHAHQGRHLLRELVDLSVQVDHEGFDFRDLGVSVSGAGRERNSGCRDFWRV